MQHIQVLSGIVGSSDDPFRYQFDPLLRRRLTCGWARVSPPTCGRVGPMTSKPQAHRCASPIAGPTTHTQRTFQSHLKEPPTAAKRLNKMEVYQSLLLRKAMTGHQPGAFICLLRTRCLARA
eukprot:2347251-Amphidinium_carterae.1